VEQEKRVSASANHSIAGASICYFTEERALGLKVLSDSKGGLGLHSIVVRLCY